MNTELIGFLSDVPRDSVGSTAAPAVTRKRGNGRMRHVRVGQLWTQEKDENEWLKFQNCDA